MTDTIQHPTAIELLEAKGATVRPDQAGQHVAALSMLKGLDHRARQEERNTAPDTIQR